MNAKNYNPDLVAFSLETERAILKEKIQEKWIRKENISKKKASYKKQKKASNKGNTHINNLYGA